jgi:hypothetical protein
MAGPVYVLSAITSLACAAFLFRGYRRTGVRLLLWSSLCFLGLAVDNVGLYVDRMIFPMTDISLYRHLVSLAAVLALLYGLVWDSR